MSDCIVVVTDHSAFDDDDLQRCANAVVETRNARFSWREARTGGAPTDGM